MTFHTNLVLLSESVPLYISRKKFSPQIIILKSIFLKYMCDHNISFAQLVLYTAYYLFIKAAKHVSHN